MQTEVEDMTLVTTIRARVFKIRKDVNTINRMHYYTQMYNNVIKSPEDYASNEFKQCQIVGYLAATYSYADNSIHIGYSYCIPEDYAMFDKEVGKDLAIKRAGDDKYITIPFDKMVDRVSSDGRAYYWTINPAVQLNYFIERCKKYFKSEKINAVVKLSAH